MRFPENRKELLSPSNVIKYLKRAACDRRLWASSKNFLDFYAHVVDDNAGSINPDLAIGSYSHEHWLEIGRLQFDFLVAHGLRQEHRFLDVGCGNFRLGANLIPYLDELGYVGIDISPRIVTAALDTIRTFKLQSKLPRIFLVSETSYEFFPESYFDAANAHSVFTHLPIEEIEKVVREAFRVLKPRGWFDFTFFNRREVGTISQRISSTPSRRCWTLQQVADFERNRLPIGHIPRIRLGPPSRAERSTGFMQATPTLSNCGAENHVDEAYIVVFGALIVRSNRIMQKRACIAIYGWNKVRDESCAF